MNYVFTGIVEESNGNKQISIPFNLWEVSDEKGAYNVFVTVSDFHFECELEPKGSGYYDMPIPASVEGKLITGEKYRFRFHISGSEKKKYEDSPYCVINPIRKIENINLVKQPWDGLCGQACIAMLAGMTLDDACEVMHCREWQATMSVVIDNLDYLGIAHADEIIYTDGENFKLPPFAIVLEKLGRYSHYLIYFKNKFYDMNDGILDEIENNKILGYLELY